jgi:4-oxalomesaconate tautomerase
MQKGIPYMHFRGGSSKGIFFKTTDLPFDEDERNKIAITAMEGTLEGDVRQTDGLGGGSSLTSKVALVGPSLLPNADLDYLFLQVIIGKGKVATVQTCGNILAGVLPFAIESGMFNAQHPITAVRIHMVNTGGICEVIVQTPYFKVNYAGNAKIDGVMGTSAPIICNYLETVGSTCGALLPTGNSVDTINGVTVTCIDNGMPVVLLRAKDLGVNGDESKETLEANDVLKQKIEQIRLQAGKLMNLGDISDQTIPKMCLISPPMQGGTLSTRMFIPHVVHDAIGVLAAVSVASACIVSQTVTDGIANFENGAKLFSIEHPSGVFTVSLDYELTEGNVKIIKSGVIRTARLISKGEVFIPDFNANNAKSYYNRFF